MVMLHRKCEGLDLSPSIGTGQPLTLSMKADCMGCFNLRAFRTLLQNDLSQVLLPLQLQDFSDQEGKVVN